MRVDSVDASEMIIEQIKKILWYCIKQYCILVIVLNKNRADFILGSYCYKDLAYFIMWRPFDV